MAWPWEPAAAPGGQNRRLWHSCSTLRVKGSDEGDKRPCPLGICGETDCSRVKQSDEGPLVFFFGLLCFFRLALGLRLFV